MVSECQCPSQFPMVRVSEGKYKIGETRVLIFVRVSRLKLNFPPWEFLYCFLSRGPSLYITDQLIKEDKHYNTFHNVPQCSTMFHSFQILRSHVMVRVGGGWDTLQNYLDKHDPCRCRRGEHCSTIQYSTVQYRQLV